MESTEIICWKVWEVEELEFSMHSLKHSFVCFFFFLWLYAWFRLSMSILQCLELRWDTVLSFLHCNLLFNPCILWWSSGGVGKVAVGSVQKYVGFSLEGCVWMDAGWFNCVIPPSQWPVRAYTSSRKKGILIIQRVARRLRKEEEGRSGGGDSCWVSSVFICLIFFSCLYICLCLVEWSHGLLWFMTAGRLILEKNKPNPPMISLSRGGEGLRGRQCQPPPPPPPLASCYCSW